MSFLIFGRPMYSGWQKQIFLFRFVAKFLFWYYHFEYNQICFQCSFSWLKWEKFVWKYAWLAGKFFPNIIKNGIGTKWWWPKFWCWSKYFLSGSVLFWRKRKNLVTIMTWNTKLCTLQEIHSSTGIYQWNKNPFSTIWKYPNQPTNNLGSHQIFSLDLGFFFKK